MTALAFPMVGPPPTALRVIGRVVRYQLHDVVRSRWLAAYALFFLAATDALFRFSGSDLKVLLSLSSVMLFVVPLVSLVFGTVYLYNAREFIELLLAQPVRRRDLFLGLYLGLAFPLAAGFVAGVAIPLLVHRPAWDAAAVPLAMLLGGGVALTAIFSAVAFAVAVRVDDRLRGLGIAIALWLGASLLYDGLVLVLLAIFADYPLERATLALMLANPIDLVRVGVLLCMDAAALMGYTGAVFQRFFAQLTGLTVIGGMLAMWIAAPLVIALRTFLRKDF